MAANLAALNNYLNGTLFIPLLVRDAVIAQGLSSFDDFIGLSDSDVKNVCTNDMRPGGSIQNPAWVVDGIMPQFITNPGAAVGKFHEIRFRQLRFYRNYLSLVQRPMIPLQSPLIRLVEAWVFSKEIKNHDNSILIMPLKLEKSDEARKVIENLDDYLKKHRNANGIPLAYLTRDDVAAPDVADDPGYATPSFDKEMIRRF